MREPFKIAVPDDVLDDLQRRLANTRLPPDAGPAAGWDDGVEPAYLADLISYWRAGYDWRDQERTLNQFHHFRATVDGTRLHFIHERGAGPSPMPLVLTHGYPDCFYRFHKLIPLLIDPAAHGGDAADAFDVVVPSLPGYAFSEPRTQSGGVFGFGSLWHGLMTDELGYRRYGAHGGDWGSTVSEQLARSHASAVIGIHLTDIPFWHTFQKPKDLSAAESRYLDSIQRFQTQDGAYAMIQGTRPRTPAPALNDSPAGLAAWIIEKFQEWSDCDGNLESRFSKDELLTNVMIYWITQTIGSSFQPYRDFMKAGVARWITEAAKGFLGSTATPAGIALFPKDIAPPPHEWANRFYNVQRWTEMPRGGHFAALEEPECLAEDIRAFFRPLRQIS
jgi:pimeloyl-ACP methyl ester carboxylesterase